MSQVFIINQQIGNCLGRKQPSTDLTQSPSWSLTPKFNLDINLHRGLEPRLLLLKSSSVESKYHSRRTRIKAKREIWHSNWIRAFNLEGWFNFNSLQIWKLLLWYINLIKRFRSDALCDFYKINLGTSAQGHSGDLTSKLNSGRGRKRPSPALVQFGCQISLVALSLGPSVDFVEISLGWVWIPLGWSWIPLAALVVFSFNLVVFKLNLVRFQPKSHSVLRTSWDLGWNHTRSSDLNRLITYKRLWCTQ